MMTGNPDDVLRMQAELKESRDRIKRLQETVENLMACRRINEGLIADMRITIRTLTNMISKEGETVEPNSKDAGGAQGCGTTGGCCREVHPPDANP